MGIKGKIFFGKNFEGAVWNQWRIMERWKIPWEMLPKKRLSAKSSLCR